jgi:ABC-2 type transport system permease protein
MKSAARVARQTVIFAVAEMRSVYTWRTWVFGWLARLLAQVTFFAVIARYVGGAETMRYALIGNAVVLVCLESMIVVVAMVNERAAGTLPLLAVTPTSHVPIYLGRGAHWLASGMTSSLIAWMVLPPLLRVPLPWPNALIAMPMIAVIGISSYCYGCFLSSLAIRWPGMMWIFLNLGYLPVMAFCGVNVPLSFWPGWMRAAAGLLPVTHGLSAIRSVLAGGPWPHVILLLAAEMLVGLAWVLIAAISIGRVLAKGRTDGSLEFGN